MTGACSGTDRATSVPQRGDLWALGDHRLLCGDAGDTEYVDRLLDGSPIHLVNTDPPYNVKVEPRSNNAIAAGNSSFPEARRMHHQAFDVARQGAKHATHKRLRPKDRPLANDFVSDEAFNEMLLAWFTNIARVLEPGRAFYIWGGYANIGNYPPVLRVCGLYFSQAIIWDKEHPVLTRKDYMGAHEWCFYGWREGAAHVFLGPNNVPDLWHVKKINPNAMIHLTEKPVELAVRAMQYSSRVGENVLDLFGGSGSTGWSASTGFCPATRSAKRWGASRPYSVTPATHCFAGSGRMRRRFCTKHWTTPNARSPVLLVSPRKAGTMHLTRRDLESFLAQARPRPLRTMRAFAEEEIVIPDGPYAGRRFRCSRQPYTGLWFEHVDSGKWSRCVATGPTQSGKTLACFVIPLLYHLFEVEETVICGLPDMDMATDKWREDILPAIERSRYRDLLPQRGGGSRGGRVESLQFTNGATLKFMSGGGGDKSRAGFTSRVVAITETDGLDQPAGTSRESDKITQLEARTRAYGARKRIYMERGYPLRSRNSYVRRFWPTSWRYGTGLTCTACSSSR